MEQDLAKLFSEILTLATLNVILSIVRHLHCFNPSHFTKNYPCDSYNIFICKYMADAVSFTVHHFSAFREMVESF